MTLAILWQVEPADSLENEPVQSDIPTLILAGDYDPITSPAFGQAAAAYLENAHYVELSGQSHSTLSSSECAQEIATDFLDNPTASPDESCLEHLFFGFATP